MRSRLHQLLDQQDIFKIIDKIEPAITNGIECVQPRKDVGFNGFVVEDVIATGYWFWIDTDNTVCVTCRFDIEFDIFADENHKLTNSVGSFEAIVELEGANEYANKFIKDALNTTLDVVSKRVHDFISFRVSYLDVREIGE